MKKLITAFLYAIMSTTVFAQDFSGLSFGTDSTLDIATWNLQNFPKAENTILHLAEIIPALDLDIVALQEISDTASFAKMIELLDDWGGYSTSDSSLNLGFLFRSSRIEALDFFQIEKQNTQAFPRPPLLMHFDYEGDSYFIINNHLKCCGDEHLDRSDPWDEESRRLAASNFLHKEIEDNYPDERVILLGDLNDHLDEEPAQNVFQPFLDDSSSYLFADWNIATGNSDLWSYPFWPSHLDHILITNELFPDLENTSESVATLQLDDAYDGGFFEYQSNISDHLPVAMRLRSPGHLTTQTLPSQASMLINNFPNPFKTIIWFDLTMAPEVSHLFIYDIYGRKTQHLAVDPSGLTLWDAAQQPAGTYYVTYRQGHHVINQVILQKID